MKSIAKETSRTERPSEAETLVLTDRGIRQDDFGRTRTPNRELTCAHCGEPCGGLAVATESHTFCCLGCKTVFEILSQHDLCAYYDLAPSAAGISMRRVRTEQDAFAVLDEPEVRRSFITFASNDRERVVWTVPSLHCASCVWLLEQLDRLQPGIWSSSVDILRKSVTVDYDPRVTRLRDIATTMASVGYAPLVRLAESGQVGQGRTDLSSTRGLYARIGITGFAAGNTMMMYISRYFAGASGLGPELTKAFSILAIILSVPVLLYCASPWWVGVRTAIRRRRVTLDVPVAIGIAVLFVRSVLDITHGTSEGYLDSFTGLVFFLLVGRLFQQKAFDALSFDRTYRSFFPLSVRIERSSAEHGNTEPVIPIEQVAVGDILVVRNGEVVPCDAVMLTPSGYLDYSFVTGEALPVECTEHTTVYAGGRVVGRALRLVATKKVSHSELARMWDRTSSRKARTQLLDLSDRFGERFTLIAVTSAVLAAALWLPDLTMAFNVFTAVLIIACPCALTLATPITLGSGMGRLGARGIFLKNIGVLLELGRVDTIVFDKTGTLTSSTPDVSFHGATLTEAQWRAVRAVAAHSSHPTSRALAIDGALDASEATAIHETIGAGITGEAFGQLVAIGSLTLLRSMKTSGLPPTGDTAAAGHVAIDGGYCGAIELRSRLRAGIREAVAELRKRMSVRLLSGDTDRDRTTLAPLFGDAHLTFGQRPEQKIEAIEQLQREGRVVLMVGDGLNDAGAMQASDLAIAVTDDTATLVPACDIIVRAEAIRTLPALLRYQRVMKASIWASLLFSIVYNIIGLGLAASGLLSPIIAAIMMPVSSLVVIAISVFSARLGMRLFDEQKHTGGRPWA